MRTADIPVGGGTVFTNANIVVTQPTAGAFKAFDATCQHLGCQVISVRDGKINCPCHGSQYNIADGSVARGPTTRGLITKTLTITAGIITVS
jgi:Rieske Fe-S protein